MLSISDWGQRYLQQASWTYPLRQYLYRQVKIQEAKKILDVGCGTGALLTELFDSSGAGIFGVDIDSQALAEAGKNSSHASLVLGDAHSIPYHSNSFDLVLCHFVLLWTKNPAQVIAEMKRVASPGGTIMAIAEPDYPGRIDYPQNLEHLGRLQTEALRRQGAEPALGRRLAGLFSQSGVVDLEAGVLGGQWRYPLSVEESNSEWKILRADLDGFITPQEITQYHIDDAAARQKGERMLYVPTFYAWGHKPG
jgi:SAM-dependent methyltransferase